MWEIHQSVAFHMQPTGDLACNPGMSPDWALNWWPFCSQAGTQSTESHRPRKILIPYLKIIHIEIDGTEIYICLKLQSCDLIRKPRSSITSVDKPRCSLWYELCGVEYFHLTQISFFSLPNCTVGLKLSQ